MHEVNAGLKMTHDKTCTKISSETTLTHVWSLILLKGFRTCLPWLNLLAMVDMNDASLMMYQMTMKKNKYLKRTTENKLGPFSFHVEIHAVVSAKSFK